MDKELNKELKDVWGDVFGMCLTGVSWLVAPFWLSLPLTAYMVSNCSKNTKRRSGKKEWDWKESERVAEELAHPKIDPRPEGTADEIFPYKSCIVEVFRYPKFTARVLGPNGKDIGINFENIADAIGEIEEYAPKPRTLKGQGIKNVRIVR